MMRTLQPCHRKLSPYLAEYFRLNDITVKRVRGNGYCGFHTASVLLNRSEECGYEARRALVTQTMKYMMSNKENPEIRVYLETNKAKTGQDLHDLPMKNNRWLTVDELHFILSAHGQNSRCITKNSYPLYSVEYVYFHIDNHHFQPVISAIAL